MEASQLKKILLIKEKRKRDLVKKDYCKKSIGELVKIDEILDNFHINGVKARIYIKVLSLCVNWKGLEICL